MPMLGGRIETIAARLHAAGVRDGDRVGLAMKDHPDHLLAHYAVARLGAIILPVDHRWTDIEKAEVATTFGATLVVTDGGPIANVKSLALDGTGNVGASLPPDDNNRDQPLLISLSSGTTGQPKGALVTHGNLYERFVSQWAAIGFDSRDCFALLTPLFFGAGRSFGMCLLAAGGTVRLAPPPLKPEQMAAVLQRPEVSATFLPPTLLRRLLPLADGREPLLQNLQYLLVSGEPLHASEADECRRKICSNLVAYYASSEGGGISVLKSADFAEHSATVGIPTFRTEVEIVDDDGQALAHGEVGRLRYRGPGVATKFLDSDGREQTADSDGWFYPGDLAEKLPTGHIALRGRDKDVVIRGGVNVYPAEIEAALQQMPAVTECAVIGIDDENHGQLLVACVVTAASDDDLERHCRARLAPYKIPESLRAFRRVAEKQFRKDRQKGARAPTGEHAMRRLLPLLLAALPLSATADNGALDVLAKLMQGRFDTHAPGHASDLPHEGRLIDSRQLVDAPDLGAVVFYLQLNQGEDLSLYRQRILIFEVQDGGIIQKAYTLNDAPKFVDAQRGDAALDALTMDDLNPMFQEGCGQVWTQTDTGFSGYTDPATCRIISGRTGKPRRIESEALLTGNSLSLVERGYDDDMNQLFGTPQGESTRLHRVE